MISHTQQRARAYFVLQLSVQRSPPHTYAHSHSPTHPKQTQSTHLLTPNFVLSVLIAAQLVNALKPFEVFIERRMIHGVVPG